MPNEATIARMMDIFTEVIDLGGVEERTAIVPNLSVTDAAPTGLAGFITVQDDRDGDNILAKTVPGVVYANNDKVNVLFVKGTEPIAFQQGSESSSSGIWGIVPSTSTDIFYDNGNVGIGKSVAPDATLEVLDTAQAQLRLTHTEDTKFVDFTLDTNHDLTITPSSTGQIILQPTTDSLDFFQVLDANGGTPVLNVDSTNERVGIKIAAPAQELHIADSNAPTLRIDDTDDADSYVEITDVSATQARLRKHSSSGNATLDIDPLPDDNLGIAQFRFFRSTDTVGEVRFQIFRGDNTATLDAQVSAGDIDTFFSIPTAASMGIGTISPAAKLAVDQPSTTGAKPVALFDQADISEEMFEFVSTIGVGNAIEAVGAKTLTTTHFIKVTLPGSLTRYFPVGTIA